MLAGLLIVASALNARGTDLRPARNTDLVSLLQAQSRRNAELTERATALRAEVDGLSAGQSDQTDLGSRLAERQSVAGLTAVSGPAVTVTLDDAPETVTGTGIDPDLLVVHQQDIQAVVNALWSGGAEAMTIQDQRVVSTTGIKCVGNTVVLHGVPYAPPYVITAIGDQEQLRAALGLLGAGADLSPVRRGVRAGLPRAVTGGGDAPPARGFRGPAICAATEPGYGRMTAMAARILVIDNYDSFVYNLVQYLAQIGAEVEVWRNDDPRFADPEFSSDFDGILLSPGPGIPEEAGVCVDVVRTQAGRLPIFGVCLGLQAIGVAYGGLVDRAPELLHGKTSLILHEGVGVLAGLPSPFTATRYHSLAIEPDTMPDVLEITASTPSGVIMAIRHSELPVEAVQFHPESVLTEWGYQMLANWLVVCGDPDAPARAVGMAPLMSPRRSRRPHSPRRNHPPSQARAPARPIHAPRPMGPPSAHSPAD